MEVTRSPYDHVEVSSLASAPKSNAVTVLEHLTQSMPPFELLLLAKLSFKQTPPSVIRGPYKGQSDPTAGKRA